MWNKAWNEKNQVVTFITRVAIPALPQSPLFYSLGPLSEPGLVLNIQVVHRSDNAFINCVSRHN